MFILSKKIIECQGINYYFLYWIPYIMIIIGQVFTENGFYRATDAPLRVFTNRYCGKEE